jgi:hypothetical protein
MGKIEEARGTARNVKQGWTESGDFGLKSWF